VVHIIVQKQGGVVSVGSELGKGSVFDPYLPCIQGEETSAAPIQEEIPNGQIACYWATCPVDFSSVALRFKIT